MKPHRSWIVWAASFGGDAEVAPLVVAVDAGWHGDALRSRARLKCRAAEAVRVRPIRDRVNGPYAP
jgi:hypothetical protein